MKTFSKRFKGKTLKALVVQEQSSFFGGTIYCPWCSEMRTVTTKASDKRAADFLFNLIKTHYSIAHKDK